MYGYIFVNERFSVHCYMEKEKRRMVTLKHIYHRNDRYIGLKFYPDKVIQALVKELPQPKWHAESNCVIIKNTKENLTQVFQKFRGVAWVNGQYRATMAFLLTDPSIREILSLTWIIFGGARFPKIIGAVQRNTCRS